MHTVSDHLASYGRVAHTESDPVRQIVLLYDGAIRFLNMTASDIEAADMTAKAEHSSRALDIIGYLHATLDFDRGGEVAERLDRLYRHITSMTLRGSAKPSAALIRNAVRLLMPVRDAWESNATASTRTAAVGSSGVQQI
jgi:flagellar protein FliS